MILADNGSGAGQGLDSLPSTMAGNNDTEKQKTSESTLSGLTGWQFWLALLSMFGLMLLPLMFLSKKRRAKQES
ncbi:hypothetical protein EHS89_06620 [Amphritea balenae]|uniref:Uncharacterized protein n=1 Tax=Amphritea balenae TaxID=452629 RepID=A0A3P1SRU2_9GAMM|nr:hypothetical protein EHS89_06620 [Amphritea balenae]